MTLSSISDTVFYFNLISSLSSMNILSSLSFISYEQSYSMLYFINASLVGQIDLVLSSMLRRNINYYINN